MPALTPGLFCIENRGYDVGKMMVGSSARCVSWRNPGRESCSAESYSVEYCGTAHASTDAQVRVAPAYFSSGFL